MHSNALCYPLLPENRAVLMLQRKERLPVECDTRLVRLSHTVWTQLTRNTWIYFAPRPDTVTILCQNENPTDVTQRSRQAANTDGL